MRSGLTRVVILAALLMVIQGCYSVKSVKMGTIAHGEKSIEVPATGFSVLEIKDALVKDGWIVKVANPNVTRVRLDSANPVITSANDYDAAYRMMISESVRNDMFVIGLSTSVVNNKSNAEVLSMYFDSKGFGGCSPAKVAQDIVKELRSLEK